MVLVDIAILTGKVVWKCKLFKCTLKVIYCNVYNIDYVVVSVLHNLDLYEVCGKWVCV